LAAGYFAVPSADTAEAKQSFLEDLLKKCQGRGNKDIYRVLADSVLVDVAWLKEHGAQFSATVPLAPYRLNVAIAAPGAYAGMPNLLGTLRRRFTDLGGKISYETKAKQLIVNDRGRVAGVRAVGADGVVDYMANAVVIATGGYAGNKFLLEDLVDPNAGGMMVRGTPWATGDGLIMAQEAGASLVNMAGLTSLHIAAVNGSEPAAGNPFQAMPHCLAINREGKRYIDEALGYVANGKATLRQPLQTTALIFDEERSMFLPHSSPRRSNRSMLRSRMAKRLPPAHPRLCSHARSRHPNSTRSIHWFLASRSASAVSRSTPARRCSRRMGG
jgi:succinate dehydrogenase/fumarate reductase flavoprotein subunit